ncbi:MAG: hypothetical protein J6X55_13260 [Victivallales bacterium]|nr:hypothetical protein [Victivallales bacterium]
MAGLDRIREIPRAYRRVGRFRSIMRVLMRYGFDSIVDIMRNRYGRSLRKIIRPWHDDTASEMKGKSVGERTRLMLIELGPTFVKLGQLLAGRQDILPKSFTDELAKLQDSVPPFGMDEVRELIRQEFGSELETFFSEFNETPVGAASMAQGHHARLIDGTEVFVKLQRPGISTKMMLDVDILRHMAQVVERHSEELAQFQPSKIVEQFAKALEQELDFCHELSNQEKFAAQFEGREGIHVPKVYPELSSRRVLVMEFIRGIRATDMEALKSSGIDLKTLSCLAADLVFEQFFEHGFYHSDPHPGNIFFLRSNQLCYVDYGQCGRITEGERMLFAKILGYLVTRNYRGCATILLELTEHDEDPDLDELERSIGEFIETHLHTRLSRLDVATTLSDWYSLCKAEKITLRPQLYLLLKAIGESDRLGREMNPDFEIMKQLRPFVLKMAFKRFSADNILREINEVGGDLFTMLREYPQTIRQFNRQLVQGKATLRVNADSIERMNVVFDSVFNRLASAVVLASMIIGSSIVVHANPKPHWYDTSILGVVGFLLSGIFGAVLLVDIWRHRNKGN